MKGNRDETAIPTGDFYAVPFTASRVSSSSLVCFFALSSFMFTASPASLNVLLVMFFRIAVVFVRHPTSAVITHVASPPLALMITGAEHFRSLCARLPISWYNGVIGEKSRASYTRTSGKPTCHIRTQCLNRGIRPLAAHNIHRAVQKHPRHHADGRSRVIVLSWG